MIAWLCPVCEDAIFSRLRLLLGASVGGGRLQGLGLVDLSFFPPSEKKEKHSLFCMRALFLSFSLSLCEWASVLLLGAVVVFRACGCVSFFFTPSLFVCFSLFFSGTMVAQRRWGNVNAAITFFRQYLPTGRFWWLLLLVFC